MDEDRRAERTRQVGGGKLYSRCAALAVKLLEPRLESLFESIDDTLFDLADKAASNAQQTHFFDGMREARKKQGAVEREFRDQLIHNFAEFGRGNPFEAASRPPPVIGAQMSLVEDRELEQDLAMSEMIARGEKHLSEPLAALNQRLGALLRAAPPQDAQNPVGPAGVCRCFRLAAQQLEVENPVLIVVYKLFERHVVEKLDSVYDGINQELIGHGILPHLRVTIAAPERSAAGPAGAPWAPLGAIDDSPEAIADGGQPLPELLASVLELLSGRRRKVVPAADIDPQLVRTTDLLNALHVLQAEPSEAGPTTRGMTIKGVVLDQAAKLTARETVSAAARDEDSIDLVAMLFEFILQDRNLPDAMQVLLSRLQIPYLKVALLDRRLFANKDHPARRLLDALSEASVGWSRESDRGERLYKKVSEMVEAVLREFDDDVGTFERLVVDFEDFLSKTKRRAEVAEKRTTEATQGRERLQRARRRAGREISARIEPGELPKLIEDILRKPWANALVLTHLRHGEDSAEFRQGLQFVDDLIWTAQPKTTAGDVARLQSTLPNLSRRLRTGLAMVAYQDEDIARVFKSLKQLYRSMIDSQYREHLTMPGLASKPKRADWPAPAAPVVLPVSDGDGNDIVSAAAVDDSAPPPAEVDEVRLQWVMDLEVGTWFELRDEAGNKIRAKLSWKSPITSKFLLVDQKGIKVADRPVEDLAREILNGDTVVLEAVPLFQRALGAIADRLRDEESHREGPGGAGGDPKSPATGAG